MIVAFILFWKCDFFYLFIYLFQLNLCQCKNFNKKCITSIPEFYFSVFFFQMLKSKVTFVASYVTA